MRDVRRVTLPGATLDDCQASHYGRKILDEVESHIGQIIAAREDESILFSNQKASKRAVAKARELLEPGLDHDTALDLCVHGDSSNWYINVQASNASLCHEGTPEWSTAKNKVFDEPFTTPLNYLAKRIKVLRDEHLIKSVETCVAGIVDGVEDPCVSKKEQTVKIKGYNDASQLAEDLRGIAHIGRDGYLVSPERQYYSFSTEEMWEFLTTIQEIKSNAFTAYTQFQCAADEAFTQLKSGWGTGKLAVSKVNGRIDSKKSVPAAETKKRVQQARARRASS